MDDSKKTQDDGAATTLTDQGGDAAVAPAAANTAQDAQTTATPTPAAPAAGPVVPPTEDTTPSLGANTGMPSVPAATDLNQSPLTGEEKDDEGGKDNGNNPPTGGINP